jgi:nucleoid-associated protein YgaU
MLNKDQYNQDEYNDYYQQEIRGAETNSSVEEEPSKKGGILILLGVIILAVAGYFGYTTMNTSTADSITDETIVVQKEVEEPAQSIQTVEKPKSIEESVEIVEKEVVPASPKESIQTVKEEAIQEETKTPKDDEITEVSNSVQKAIGNEQKMSPEEIAKVVQMVMSQMASKSEEEPQDQDTAKKEEPAVVLDTELISALSGTDTDSVDDEDQKLEDALNNINETTKDTSIKNDDKAVDTYNKVKISENTGDDELSKLSSQISSLISDKTTSDQTNNSKKEKTYTESLKQEVVTRKNEMRIIVVRKGDTLGRIAKRAYGNVMEYKKIYKANPDILKRPDRIYVGQKLRIPK